METPIIGIGGRIESEQVAGLRRNPHEIFEYVEIFHNRSRRHSSLGMLTPIEFEEANGQVVEIT